MGKVNILIATNDYSIYDQIDEAQLIGFVGGKLNEKQIDIIYPSTTTGVNDKDTSLDTGSDEMTVIYIIIGVAAVLLLIVIIISLIYSHQKEKQYADAVKISSELELEATTNTNKTAMGPGTKGKTDETADDTAN